ncbi:MAG: ABC transporter ATP-binding protein [Thermoleophilia bacterium]
MDAVIEAQELTKRYRGGARGVTGLTLAVGRGEVFGFLGPNGAGKSTTIRLMLDLLRPTSGHVRVLGLDPRRDGVAVRARLGYVPGDLRLYERLTGGELLAYLARLRGMDGTGDAAALAARFDLDLTRPIRALSRGNRQKVGLVQAFMHRPDLLVLDEPTSGLDPLMQRTFGELVRETAANGGTVFLSSHVLSEVQHLAGRVGLIRDGRLELVEDVEALRARARSRVEVTFADPPPPGALDDIPGVVETGREGNRVLLRLEGDADALVKRLAGHTVRAIDAHEADLEDIFLSRYGEEADR